MMYLEMVKAYLRGMVKDEKGQGMVEYGLIIALVAIVLIAGLGLISGGLDTLFTKVGNTVKQ